MARFLLGEAHGVRLAAQRPQPRDECEAVRFLDGDGLRQVFVGESWELSPEALEMPLKPEQVSTGLPAPFRAEPLKICGRQASRKLDLMS
jgi:hypothetical protein